MSDPITVRIGMSSARELELAVEDPSVVAASYEKALKGKDNVLWVTDTRGHRFGLAVASIAFIEVEEPQDRGVGFAARS
jgi:hypothetical protein